MQGLELRDLDFEQVPYVREKTFRSVALGDDMERYALDIETAAEHAERHGASYERILNQSCEDILKADFGDRYLEVINSENTGETTIRLGGESEKHLDTIWDRVIDKLLAREQAVYQAATNYVHRVLPSDEDELEILEDEVEWSGGDIATIVDAYYNDPEEMRPTDLVMQYSWMFELKPHQAVDDNLHDMEREMPLGRAEGDLVERDMFWLKKYLGETIELALRTYTESDNGDGLRNFWLDS